MKDISGSRFGRLVALSPAFVRKQKWHWNFMCDCGKECIKVGAQVSSDFSQGIMSNCGCTTSKLLASPHITHGLSYHAGYTSWSGMKRRCSSPKDKSYSNYGGRGIRVCPEWESSFEAFWADMGPTYQQGLQIDRINNDGNYEPGNCRWTTPTMNCRNRRSNQMISTPWGRMTVIEASEKSGLYVGTIYARLKMGWDSTRAATTPAGPNGPKAARSSK